ncbi:hypothetical protein TNCT_19041 [Trichonephila clavata]|uniref:Uncharacterized protein n=1 Tax=Trichonephila clavata TaxID=2740835 RepID=A0A8X6FJV1_TRICU|nr:hypothetical protein TNCT_19041 [Trichonephila clavata]
MAFTFPFRFEKYKRSLAYTGFLFMCETGLFGKQRRRKTPPQIPVNCAEIHPTEVLQWCLPVQKSFRFLISLEIAITFQITKIYYLSQSSFHVAKLDSLEAEKEKTPPQIPVNCAGIHPTEVLQRCLPVQKSFRFLRFLQKQQLHLNFVTKIKKLSIFHRLHFRVAKLDTLGSREGGNTTTMTR